MVSVAVSKLGKMDVVFVQPGAKINSVYNCENVFEHGLLPAFRRIKQILRVQAGWSAMHAICHTVAYLRSSVPEFTELEKWLSNSPDLNLADYSECTALRQMV